jgi:hypothetical protein
VSLFGRGFGECICVHVGAGEWVVVDSCLSPIDGRPAALSYLRSIGVDVGTAVKLVVVTHWDDDHIAGIAEVVREAQLARVACSVALRSEDWLQFVMSQEGSGGAAGSGLDELRTVLRHCAERGGGSLIWAKSNLPLHPIPPGDQPVVVTLSPSENAAERSMIRLIEAATGESFQLRRRYKAPEDPNGGSVATVVRVGDVCIVLGADLEATANPDAGWEAVVRYSRPARSASLIKVPHHGSKGAHHDQFWDECVDDDAIAVLSPWAHGGGFLPQAADLERLDSVAGDVYLSSLPVPQKAKMSHEVERLVRRLHGGREIKTLNKWGQVQLRRGLSDDQWSVQLFGDAVKVGKR